jgi:hypothetical protein
MNKLEFLIEGIEKGLISKEDAYKLLKKDEDKSVDFTDLFKTEELKPTEPILDTEFLIHRAIFGGDDCPGLDFDAILNYCEYTGWQMLDEDCKCKNVTKKMAVKNARDLCESAIEGLKEKYKEDGDEAEYIVHSGLFRVCAYIDFEMVNLEIQFIANESSGCIEKDFVLKK